MTGCGTSRAQSSSKTDNAVKMSDYDGDMTATVFQSASGQAAAALQAAINLASKQEVNAGISYELDGHTIWIPFEKVTEDNIGEYY